MTSTVVVGDNFHALFNKVKNAQKVKYTVGLCIEGW